MTRYPSMSVRFILCHDTPAVCCTLGMHHLRCCSFELYGVGITFANC